jgi:hypothetical protein
MKTWRPQKPVSKSLEEAIKIAKAEDEEAEYTNFVADGVYRWGLQMGFTDGVVKKWSWRYGEVSIKRHPISWISWIDLDGFPLSFNQ